MIFLLLETFGYMPIADSNTESAVVHINMKSKFRLIDSAYIHFPKMI